MDAEPRLLIGASASSMLCRSRTRTSRLSWGWYKLRRC